jgi:hypothetical protein
MQAWLWPLILDMSIAQATLAMLALWRPEQAATQGDYEDLVFGMDEDFGNGAAEELDGCRRRGRSCAAHTVRTGPRSQGTQETHSRTTVAVDCAAGIATR